MILGMPEPCPICESPEVESNDFGEFDCFICGPFKIHNATRAALDGRRKNDQKWLFPALSAATRQEKFYRDKHLTLTPDNFLSYANSHRWTSVSEKLHKVLEVARKRSHYFGAPFDLDPARDYPLFDAISADEGQALNVQLTKSGLIEFNGDDNYILTHRGWEALEPINASGIAGRCFVAMAFDPELESAYVEGIKPALIACGYDPICLRETTTNDDVCDLILAELRKAQFIVADFTKQKGGVYFEAGFGKALGKEIFWTCREDDFKNLHFDTNHYGHIKWSQPEDLRRQLQDRIMAEIGRGPHQREGEAAAGS